MADREKNHDKLGVILAVIAILLLMIAMGGQILQASSVRANMVSEDVDVTIESTQVLTSESIQEATTEPDETKSSDSDQETPEPISDEDQSPGFDPDIEYIPEKLSIPTIDLEVDIFPVELIKVAVGDQIFLQWDTLDDDVAWHNTSATLGIPGNTVLSGHHNMGEMPFKDLAELELGTLIFLESNGLVFEYEITDSMILPELNMPIAVRLKNAEWMEETDDERITLITCWPAESNTHRVFVIAEPVD